MCKYHHPFHWLGTFSWVLLHWLFVIEQQRGWLLELSQSQCSIWAPVCWCSLKYPSTNTGNIGVGSFFFPFRYLIIHLLGVGVVFGVLKYDGCFYWGSINEAIWLHFHVIGAVFFFFLCFSSTPHSPIRVEQVKPMFIYNFTSMMLLWIRFLIFGVLWRSVTEQLWQSRY